MRPLNIDVIRPLKSPAVRSQSFNQCTLYTLAELVQHVRSYILHKSIKTVVTQHSTDINLQFERKCQAFDYNNHQRERDEKGKRLVFPIPNPHKHTENRHLAKMWLHEISLGHIVKKLNFRPRKLVCENHFEKS